MHGRFHLKLRRALRLRSALLAPLLLAALMAASSARAAEPPVVPPPAPTAPLPPDIPVNLITNGDFELDQNNNGTPDGWFHSDPQHWAGPVQDTALWKTLHDAWAQQSAVPPVIPFRSPDIIEGGAYQYETPGHQSGRCISIDETSDLKWGEWNSVISNVKPNTSYVILGWRRQSVPVANSSAPFPRLHIAAFGQLIPLNGPVNRDEWSPFAVQVNSGTCSGDCNIGFILPQGPAKIWLDQIAVFSGTIADIPRFLIAGHGARLDCTKNTVSASPDIECPFFFNLTWAFPAADPKLQITLDLPDGIDLTGGDWGDTAQLQDPTAELITIDGRRYVRRTFHVLPPGQAGSTSGSLPVRFWLKVAPAFAPAPQVAYYRAAWADGSQPQQQVPIDIIQFPKLAPLHSIHAGLSGLSGAIAAAREERLAKDLSRLGISILLLDGAMPPKSGDTFQTSGISAGSGFRISAAGLPADALAVDAAGKPIPGVVCPTYRGAPLAASAFAEPIRLVKSGSTLLVTDIRPALQPCFCPRCLKQFESFLQQRAPDLKPAAPAEFEAAPDKFLRQHDLWNEFQITARTDFFWTLRKELDAARETVPEHSSARIRIFAIVPNPEPPPPAIKTARLPAAPTAAAAGADVAPAPPAAPPEIAPSAGAVSPAARLGAVFDGELIAADEKQLDGRTLPHRLGDAVAALAPLLPPGGTTGAVITAGSPDIQGQVIEAALSGARLILLDSIIDADGRDLKALADALAFLQPFDDLLASGQPARWLQSSDDTTTVHCLGKDAQWLILVRSDAPRPAADITLKLELPKSLNALPLVVTDPVDHSIVARIAPAARELTLPLSRVNHLFLIAPEPDPTHPPKKPGK